MVYSMYAYTKSSITDHGPFLAPAVSRHQRNRKLRRPHIKKTNKEYDTNFSVSVRPPKFPSEHTIITEARLKLLKGRFRIQADKKAFASDVKRSMVMDYLPTMDEAPLLLEGLSTKLTVFLPLTNSDSWKDI